jgi:hypothetical protein
VLVAWVLFPLALLAVCLGCGLAVERVAGWELPGTILPSVGLALVILATPLVVVLALAGYATSVTRLRGLRPDPWPLGVGVAVFAVCAAPMVLSGNATFLGYFTLNDGAVHFALIDQLLSHGHDASALTGSSYAAVIHTYLGTSYPVGADVALGAIRPLVGQDVAWIFQPYLAVILALGGVALDELLRDVVRSRPLRATCAFVAAQAGLVYAFYLEGSIKELATTWLITLTVVLVFATLRARMRLRSVVPLIVVAIAGLDVLQLAIVPWLGPPIAVFVGVAGWRARPYVRRAPRRRVAIVGAAAALVIAALTVAIIGRASTFLNVAGSVLTQPHDLGNLGEPLTGWQLFGIWPTGDFRLQIARNSALPYVLIGIGLVSAVFGTLWLVRRRSWPPLVLLAGTGISAAVLLTRASPYASAKVLVIFSLTVVLTAMLGAAALDDGNRRIEAWLLALAIAGGVLWTNALGYRYAAIAPRAQLSELSSINSRFSGQGPTFYNLADEYAVHFLRNSAPTDPVLTPPKARPAVPPRTVSTARLPWDPDDVSLDYLEGFRLLVLGRSPRNSRPPSNFSLVYQGRYFEVWERGASPRVLTHVPLGTGLEPAAVPKCSVVQATAAQAAREHARLAYVARAPDPAFVPSQGDYPAGWGRVAGDPYSIYPKRGGGGVVGYVNVAQPGRYDVWVQSSVTQPFQVAVGVDRVGSVSNTLGPDGQFTRVGSVTLAPGRQPVLILRASNDLRPGSAGTGWLLGPLILVPQGPTEKVSEISPQDARSLCGRSLDWLEIVR